jgi:hypothetical protein
MPLVFLITLLTFFQSETCAVPYQTAVMETGAVCSESETNAVCYGSGAISAELNPSEEWEVGVEVLSGDIRGLTLEDPASIAVGMFEWGAAEVSMIAFGAVRLENTSGTPTDFTTSEVLAGRQGAELYGSPDETNESGVFITWGERMTAVGKRGDEWIAVIYNDVPGWVKLEALQGEIDNLNEIDSFPNSLYAPFQRLRLFTEDPTLSECFYQPAQGGILLQTDQTVSLEINRLLIEFSGTLHIEAEIGEMRIAVLEGEATDNATFTIESRERIVRSLDEFAGDMGEESPPEPYNYRTSVYLPLDLLPREIDLPFSTAELLIPFEPGTGYLTSMALNDPCVVAWTTDVNLRRGPGTDYGLRQGIPANNSAYADARAVGTDGLVWWRLAEEVWLSSETTVFGGNCGTLPYIEVPSQ